MFSLVILSEQFSNLSQRSQIWLHVQEQNKRRLYLQAELDACLSVSVTSHCAKSRYTTCYLSSARLLAHKNSTEFLHLFLSAAVTCASSHELHPASLFCLFSPLYASKLFLVVPFPFFPQTPLLKTKAESLILDTIADKIKRKGKIWHIPPLSKIITMRLVCRDDATFCVDWLISITCCFSS